MYQPKVGKAIESFPKVKLSNLKPKSTAPHAYTYLIKINKYRSLKYLQRLSFLKFGSGVFYSKASTSVFTLFDIMHHISQIRVTQKTYLHSIIHLERHMYKNTPPIYAAHKLSHRAHIGLTFKNGKRVNILPTSYETLEQI